MSQWFKNRRQEFIAATLRQFGQIRRADLIREFDISVPQAANDIADFLATKPPLVSYDVSAKTYVLNDQPKPRCGCSAEKVDRVQAGGTCGRGGCPYGGDF